MPEPTLTFSVTSDYQSTFKIEERDPGLGNVLVISNPSDLNVDQEKETKKYRLFGTNILRLIESFSRR